MADLAILTPSRGRPDGFAGMLRAVHDTAAEPVDVWLGLDDDDDADAYREAARAAVPHTSAVTLQVVVDSRVSLSAWTNRLASMALGLGEHGRVRFLASLGDDHRPRTQAWDRLLAYLVEQCPGGVGFAYGNDLLQGPDLPTAWLASVSAYRALGWMMLPACQHLYVDRAVLEVGRMAGCLRYWHAVTIEHLHPAAGKAEMDASYQASNSADRYAADGAAFEQWRLHGLRDDAARLVAAASAVRPLEVSP